MSNVASAGRVSGRAAILLVGNLAYAASLWLLLVFVARQAGAEALAHFALALAVATPVVIFSQLQLRALLSTRPDEPELLRDFATLRLTTTVAAIAALGVLAFVWAGESQLAPLFVALGLFRGCEAISDLIYGQLQREGSFRIIGISLVLRSIALPSALALTLTLTGSLTAGCFGLAAGQAIVLGAWDVPQLLRSWQRDRQLEAAVSDRLSDRPHLSALFRWHPETLRRIAIAGLPLGAVLTCVSLQTTLPRWSLALSGVSDQLAVFVALFSLTGVGAMGAAAVGQATSPDIARSLRDDPTGRRGATRQLTLTLLAQALGLGLAGLLLAVTLGERIVSLVFGASYVDQTLLVWLAVATLPQLASSALGFLQTAMRQLGAQLTLALVSTGVLLVALWLLVPRYGVLGAAGALLISRSLDLGLRVPIALRYLHRLQRTARE